MSNLTHAKSNGESGEITSSIWLLFNPKHPIVRQYIWKLVLAEIQETLFKEIQTRIDTSKIYIRNAVNDSKNVPGTVNLWNDELLAEIVHFRELVHKHPPKILISFGSFPFEFVRRVFKTKPEKGPKYWNASKLGDEFRKSLKDFDVGKTNRIPLLRRMVESEKFIGNHGPEDYYHYVGTKIAQIIIKNKGSLRDIWID